MYFAISFCGFCETFILTKDTCF